MDGELCDTQCSYVLALEYGVADNREAAAFHLLRKTRELGHKVDVYKRQETDEE